MNLRSISGSYIDWNPPQVTVQDYKNRGQIPLS